ncbi:desmoplakin-A isoform X1 [Takifugu flavidus]|uniref:desmoplakin-A isoform X1 n=1 Tax=Takifugu flavidus TaxID=433684 RepID=UPI002544C24F|nr:desmoplakin-A isoform X1 [Takifugu flavidus]
MSLYGSQKCLDIGHRVGSKPDLTGGGSHLYTRSEFVHGAGDGYDPYLDGYTYTVTTRSAGGGAAAGGGMRERIRLSSDAVCSAATLSSIHQRAKMLQVQCQDCLKKAELALQSGGAAGDAEGYMVMAKDTIEQMKSLAVDLRQQGHPNENLVRTLEICKDQLKGVHQAITGTLHRRRSTKGSSGASWDDPGRSFQDAMSWIAQQKRLIETASWGEDPTAIEQQLLSHQRFHKSIQRSAEVDRAREELMKKGDRGNLYALDQELDSLKKMSFGRTQQLQELQQIMEEMSKEIMWVNEKEEVELVFDWGDKNVDRYIPQKQESYSKLMSDLEVKEKDLNKLKAKADILLKSNHPASDKIEAYRDTLQTQWSWLLQITKCIDIHLKENAAYNQFFKEANDTYSNLQAEHERVRQKFTCNKNTSLEELLELLRGLEMEREKIKENKRQVQHLVAKSKNIVRLKPRNPEEKSSSPIIVKALCDFIQDQKVICKGNEAILKNNSQRSKWEVTGPGGLDMTVPSVCLIVPPPNPLGISLANKNEQYYEAILSIWNQLHINVKSLIAWQYCILDVKRINTLTISMLAAMRPEEYRHIIKSLQSHFEEFKLSSQGSQMFADEDKKSMENQVNGAQNYYDQLVVQLPVYIARQDQWEGQPATAEEEAKSREEESRRGEAKKQATKKEQTLKKEVVKVVKTEPPKKKVVMSSSLSDLHALRLRLEGAEGTLSQHIHICLGDDGVHDCGLKITQLESVLHDIDAMREDFLRLRELIMKELEDTSDPDKAQFLRTEIPLINQRLASLEGSSSAHLQRLRALRDLLESLCRTEDIVKVHEARLTEKETTCLTTPDIEDYVVTLKNMKAQLDQKKDVLVSMEAQLAKVGHWNSQVGGALNRCDLMLSSYSEQVRLLGDRWRRVSGQMDSRLQDLQLYQPQLQSYKDSSASFDSWMEATRKKQESLQATKMDSVQALTDLINHQKALNSDILSKRETLEGVLKANIACSNSIKDYETDLAAYSSGLETLLNIPIKRTMLKSPTVDLHQEAVQLQTRYVTLLTMSADHHRFLGDLLKHMEELKIRNTKIDLLEEELHLLRENIQDSDAKNKALDNDLSCHKLELSQLRDNLLLMEEVKQSTVLKCTATKESLDNTQSQLSELNDQVTRLNYMLEEEKRKRRLAEERYSLQQEEYDSVLRKRQKELETVSWSKMELEKNVANKEHETERLRRQLDENAEKITELQKETSKTTVLLQSLQSQHKEVVAERDSLMLKLQTTGKDKDHFQKLEEELAEIKLTLEYEVRNKQNLMEENQRLKSEEGYWKDQYDGKQALLRQYDTDKERQEMEKNSLKREIEKLRREQREIEEKYRVRLTSIQNELQEVIIIRQNMEAELKRAKEPSTLDASTLIFDGVRSSVTANQLLDCSVLDRPTFNMLVSGLKTVPDVSLEKKINLKGTGPIAGLIIEGPNSPGPLNESLNKMTFREAKKENLLPPDSIDLLLDAQAATGHIIDPRTNQKLTVEEACIQGLVDEEDKERVLAAEAAAVGFCCANISKPLSVFQAMKKGLIDRTTTLRVLQAQESVGGILDPVLSVFLPKQTAMERYLIDEDISHALALKPELYLDPESEMGVTYMSLKRRCKVEPHTGLLLLPVSKKIDPSQFTFDGVRKTVTAKQLVDCGVLDKLTLRGLEKGMLSVPEVSVEKRGNLKGTGPIAGVFVGSHGKLSLSEAKKLNLLPEESANLLLEAQAATGHIIDPRHSQKLTVDEACASGVVDFMDRDRLLAAEAAAVGYKHQSSAKPLSVFEAMKRGLIERETGLRLLQAQESVGGLLEPNLSVFLPKDTAIKCNLLDEDLWRALNHSPKCYIDPETEHDVSYGALKKRCRTEPHTGLLLLPITEKLDPTKVIFDGVRKAVTAQQLLDCGILDKLTFNQLIKGEKTVLEVSMDKKVFLKGTGSIAGVAAGPLGKLSLSEAKKQMLMLTESADLLLDAQAATGHIIDPSSNEKLTVEEACARGVVDTSDRDRLLEAEAAAVGYREPSTDKPLALFEAMRKGLIDRKTGLRLLQAQESVGGILDPKLSVFLPRNKAIERNIIDEGLCQALNTRPEYYLDPDTELYTSYGALNKKCKAESHTGLILLPITERKDPSKLMFMGIRKPVSAKKLFERGVLDKPTFHQLVRGEKSVPMVSVEKLVYLKGTGPIAGVVVGRHGIISLSEAKKQNLLSGASAALLLEAQAATGYVIDPITNQKLTVEEACSRGVVDIADRERLLAAESAAVGYEHVGSARPLSVFEALKKGLIDRENGLRLLQAQESVGGILDPNLSVFLPKETAIRHHLLDEDLSHALKLSPPSYVDPETELNISYGALKEKCMIDAHTGLHLLPISEKADPSKLLFDGVRKAVTAQQLLDCGVLDKLTFDQLIKGEKTVHEVSIDKKLFLKGTGPIAGVAAGPFRKMSFTEAKKQNMMSPKNADLLLEAQAATGHLTDPRTGMKLTVKEACARGVTDPEDEPMLLAAEAAAMGYSDPNTATILSAGQAMNKGLINKDVALRLLQAQQAVGGILDPALSVFLPKDIAMSRGIIDNGLYEALGQDPQCYLDPDSQQPTTYVSLKTKCTVDPSSGFLLLPEPEKLLTVEGLRGHVSIIDLVDANLLEHHDIDRVRQGQLTRQEIENSLFFYLRGSTCIAGVYNEVKDQVMPIYQAMKEGLLQQYSALELLEAQAASGFIVDPVNNLYLTVKDAYDKKLFGPEFKVNLQAAEKAVIGYRVPGTDKTISLFQAIERGLVDKDRGMRLLEAQIASGGIIDPEHGLRIKMDVAYKRGYFDEKMRKMLSDHNVDYKGFFDPNTEEKLTYAELKKSCITDKKTGLILLPIMDEMKKGSTTKNTLRKRRVVIVDPETNKEMTIREAYDKGYIDYGTFLELSEQECEWEEITMIDPDGSTRLVIIDRKTEQKYDISELLKKQVISQSDLEQYRSHTINLNEFAGIITNKTKRASGLSSVTSSVTSITSLSSSSTPVQFSSTSKTLETSGPIIVKATTSSVRSRPSSPILSTNSTKESIIAEQRTTIGSVSRDSTDHHRTLSKASIALASPIDVLVEQEPVGAIFDTEDLQKISITEALNRGLVDSITAQRLLEAQACTGGIINPVDGQRLGLQEASRLGIITEDAASRLKPAQKAFFGFEDIKHKKKMSAAEATKEMWLPYEAGQRFMEFQFVTGGLYDPEVKCRRTIQDALEMGWLEDSTAHKLQDIAHHTKNLTCPKSKLKISYKEALDNCMVEQKTGVKMLQASSMSSKGISSPYNVASAPGSTTGSRSGSRRGSRRSSVDLGSSALGHRSFSTFFSPS